MNSNTIANALSLYPIDNAPTSLPVIITPKDSATTKAHEDFELSRDNMLEMIKITKQAVDQAIALATASQDPEHYDVASKLLNTYLAANKTLLDIQKQIRSITDSQPAGKVNNNLFVGSTEELAKFLNNKRK